MHKSIIHRRALDSCKIMMKLSYTYILLRFTILTYVEKKIKKKFVGLLYIVLSHKSLQF